MEAKGFLRSVGSEVSSDFAKNRTILSYEEYVAFFLQWPRHQARNAAQYLRDVMDHFGSEEIDHPAGRMRRFKLFDLTESERTKLREDGEKIDEDYSKKIIDANLDAESTKIANRRDVWMEQYGLMFGFIFVAFGCIAFLRTEQPLVLKITMAVILAFMLMIMFMKFGGCTGPR